MSLTMLRCRCGLEYPNDTLGMIGHVTSGEHAAAVANLPPTHNHSELDWHNHPRVREGCPACALIVGAGRGSKPDLICQCGHTHIVSVGDEGADAGCSMLGKGCDCWDFR